MELITIGEFSVTLTDCGTLTVVVVVFSLTPTVHLYVPDGKGFLASNVKVRL